MKTTIKRKRSPINKKGSAKKGKAMKLEDPNNDPLYHIANYFLSKASRDGELLSNLKLQKLVYYAQGLYLVIHGKSLFDHNIKAWEYGPVVPALYHKYKKHGANGIPCDKSFDESTIKKSIRSFLDEVYSVFGQFSAPRLLELTHTDACWKEAFPNGVIEHDAMRKSLRKYVRKEEK